MKRAMRLNPYYPEWYLGILAQSYRVAGRHEKAITEYDELLERRRKTGGATLLPNLGLASLYMMIGEEDKARDHAAEVLKIDPDFSLEWLRQATFFKDQAIIEEEIDALRKAGLK
jgi:adenylate cyclase